jgi:hypothetical protein
MKKKKQKIQYVEIPITKKTLTRLAKFLYVATTGKRPIWSVHSGIPASEGGEISICIHGFKEVSLKFKVVPDKYSIEELRDLLNKDNG